MAFFVKFQHVVDEGVRLVKKQPPGPVDWSVIFAHLGEPFGVDLSGLSSGHPFRMRVERHVRAALREEILEKSLRS